MIQEEEQRRQEEEKKKRIAENQKLDQERREREASFINTNYVIAATHLQ